MFLTAFRMHKSLSSSYYKVSIGFEIFFLLNILMEFIVDYYPDYSSNVPERRIKQIAINYIKKGGFLIDFITIIPFQVFE